MSSLLSSRRMILCKSSVNEAVSLKSAERGRRGLRGRESWGQGTGWNLQAPTSLWDASRGAQLCQVGLEGDTRGDLGRPKGGEL